MQIIYILIILLLSVTVLLLTFLLVFISKKTTYISDKEKEFILFAIEMFIEHSSNFKISSKDQIEKLIIELEKIKKKYFLNKKNTNI